MAGIRKMRPAKAVQTTKDPSATIVEEQEEEEDKFSDANLTKIIKDYMPLVRHAVNRISVGSANGGMPAGISPQPCMPTMPAHMPVRFRIESARKMTQPPSTMRKVQPICANRGRKP